jgi:hypothetical protein
MSKKEATTRPNGILFSKQQKISLRKGIKRMPPRIFSLKKSFASNLTLSNML